MKAGVEDILTYFAGKESAKIDVKRMFWGNKVELVAIIVAVLSGLTALVLTLIGYESGYTFAAFAVFFVCIGVYGITSITFSLRFLVGIKKETINSMTKEYQSNYEDAEYLTRFDESVLDEVIMVLEGRITYLQNSLGFLVGSIDKLGLIPAAVALYFSYQSYLENQSIGWSAYILLFLVGIYLTVIFARVLLEYLKGRISVLQLAKRIKN